MVDDRQRFPAGALRSWVSAVLRRYGMGSAHADIGAEIMVDADLTGIETHGLSNFTTHWHYAPGLRDGQVSARIDIDVLRQSAATAAWDANHGFGPVVAYEAMRVAVEKAKASGVGTVTVRNGCHLGAAGFYARMAAESGLLGMVMSHTAASVVPPGGTRPGIGTNPLAFGAPVPDGVPFVFDMAVTAAAGTKVQVARRQGKSVPPGWIVDANGLPTTDPNAMAGLLLLGAAAPGGGHKGFGLGLVVDIFSGLLSGTGSGLFQTFGPEWNVGYCVAAWDVEAFCERKVFDRDMAALVDAIHANPPVTGSPGVLVPGERAWQSRQDREARGVPLDAPVVEACRSLGADAGVPFPAPLA